MATSTAPFPLTFDVEYPPQRDRVAVLLRLFMLIPIVALLALLDPGSLVSDADDGSSGLALAGGVVFAPLVLMLLFRQKYPRWWYDWNLQLSRFASRVGAYALLLRDEYPSTDEEQAVHLDFAYPDAAQLNRWLPLVKWLLAIPHFIVLFVLFVAVVLVTFVSWIAILVTGTHPRGLFDFVVGVGRWALRVQAYAILLVTDRYPPFSLK